MKDNRFFLISFTYTISGRITGFGELHISTFDKFPSRQFIISEILELLPEQELENATIVIISINELTEKNYKEYLENE